MFDNWKVLVYLPWTRKGRQESLTLFCCDDALFITMLASRSNIQSSDGYLVKHNQKMSSFLKPCHVLLYGAWSIMENSFHIFLCWILKQWFFLFCVISWFELLPQNHKECNCTLDFVHKSLGLAEATIALKAWPTLVFFIPSDIINWF